jgi:aspartate aminotransferase-like enzyme/GNAT superfamily N-acetyltransferase
MVQAGRYVFKRADMPSEFEQIHRLNYRVFVEEVPQHAASPRGRLIDKFHAKSTYFVALVEGRVVGMLSVHDRPPFSVASRLPDPSILDVPGRRSLEVRLLAVEPEHRGGQVLAGLLCSALEYARDRYHDVYISGVAERVAMYERLGFQRLGPAVASGAARFVPMRVRLPLEAKVEKLARQWMARPRIGSDDARAQGAWRIDDDRFAANKPRIVATRSESHRVCLLPGPVAISPAVRAAFQRRPLNHRDPEFIDQFAEVRRALVRLVAVRHVALMVGSGTLANEAIAAMLAAEAGRASKAGGGLILVNGEFGERLVRQAARFGLRPRVLNWKWGQPWNLQEVNAALDDMPRGSWLWGVHLESSTGVVNDLPGVVRAARARGIRVCADCISSLGAVPLDLGGVYLASGTSGKSLGAYGGIAMVFGDAGALGKSDSQRLPSYLDVPAMFAADGPRYTFPHATLAALHAALEDYRTPALAAARYARYARLGRYVRLQLRELSIEPLAEEAASSGVLTTFAAPAGESSVELVDRCAEAGFDISGRSDYLAKRRLVQIATMGCTTRQDVSALFARLRAALVRV